MSPNVTVFDHEESFQAAVSKMGRNTQSKRQSLWVDRRRKKFGPSSETRQLEFVDKVVESFTDRELPNIAEVSPKLPLSSTGGN